MAKETVTRLVDDLEGGVAHETVKFGLDGHLYEIDTSPTRTPRNSAPNSPPSSSTAAE